MGVVRWLDRIDPRTWERATSELSRIGESLLEPDAATAFLAKFNRVVEPEWLEQLEDREDESVRPTLLNGLLEVAVREQEWYLDKALSGMEAVAKALPGGEALRDIIDFRGIDIELPSAAANIESGLYGCVSPARLGPCAALLRELPGVEAVVEAVSARKFGPLQSLLGARGGARRATALLEQEYYRSYWETLREAVLETSAAGHVLGLGMSP